MTKFKAVYRGHIAGEERKCEGYFSFRLRGTDTVPDAVVRAETDIQTAHPGIVLDALFVERTRG